MSEKTQAAFWSTIEKGDQLALSDEVTLIDQIKAKQGAMPIPLTVSEVLSVVIPKRASDSTRRPGSSIAEYRIIKLGDQKPWLVAKTVGDLFSLVLYVPSPDWQPATRQELMRDDCTFLFEPPNENRDDGWEQNLRYIDEISHEASGVLYHIKPQGELTGRGARQQLATIVEYVVMPSEAVEGPPLNVDYPELAVLEIGEADSGLIHIMLGRQVTSSDVDVVKH